MQWNLKTKTFIFGNGAHAEVRIQGSPGAKEVGLETSSIPYTAEFA